MAQLENQASPAAPRPSDRKPPGALPLGVRSQLIAPVRAMRLRYVPLLMIYFAYGALGLVDVSRDLWVKESLSLSPAELAGVAVWFTLPWSIKMVFGELADSVAILGSRRKSYVFIGAAAQAAGLVALAGAAGRWIAMLPAEQLYVLGMMLIVVGTVMQDVVADAMSTEVVDRLDAAGNPRDPEAIREDLGMVQVLGRLSLSFGILSVAGLSGWLASFLSRETVFLLGLVIPLISVTGVLMIGAESSESRSVNWKLLGGGLAFGVAIALLALGQVPYAQELIFAISIVVICSMLIVITRTLAPEHRRAILYSAIIIFAFRATPSVGDGYFWWTLDVLKFDEAFYGVLRQTSAVIGLVAMWLLAKQLTQYSVAKTLLWLSVAGLVLSAPTIALYFGIHEWTEAEFGVGARSIALIDAAAASPFAQLSMIPLLTLIAYHAPPAHRATWFALMASLMNLALVAGQIGTKYLNLWYTVERGDYSELGLLLITAAALGFAIPVAAIVLFGRRI